MAYLREIELSHEDDDSSSPAPRRQAGSRHDGDSTSPPSDDRAESADFSTRDSEGCDEDSAERSSEVANASDEIDALDDVIEGEIADHLPKGRVSHQRWQGPLPPPAVLEEYERILPGGADRAFQLAERNVGIRETREATIRVAVDGEAKVQEIIATADRDALQRGQYIAGGAAVLVTCLSFAGLFLTPWAAIGFTVPLAQIAVSTVRTVSDGRRKDAGRDNDEIDDDDEEDIAE